MKRRFKVSRGKVRGLRELNRKLQELEGALSKEIVRDANRAALTPMAEMAKRRAPDDPATAPPKDLKSSIEISPVKQGGRQMFAKPEGPNQTITYMGPTEDGYPQAMVQEFGSAPHRIEPKARGGKKGVAFETGGAETVVVQAVDHPGHPDSPYMRPAYQQHKRGAVKILARELGDRILTVARRGVPQTPKG